MQSTSRDSTADLEELVGEVLSDGGGSAAGGSEGGDRSGEGERDLTGDLWAVVDLLDGSSRLRRALSDPASDPDSKAELAARLLADRVGEPAQRVVERAVRLRWSVEADLAEALERAGSSAVLAHADADDALGDLEDELFRFSRVLAREPGLSSALADRSLPAENRVGLVRSLLQGKVRPESLRLALRGTSVGRGTLLQATMERLVAQAAARRERLVAVVRLPVALDAEQEARLTSSLEQMYGRRIHLQQDVDPTVQGGGSVRVGDEMVDGTVARRLEDAATALSRGRR